MYYTEGLKLTVVRRVLNKELTKAEARRQYSIKGHSTICKWIKKYGYLFDVKQTKGIKMKEQNATIKEYKKKIAELEKALSKKNKEYEDKALEARLWKKMVELAEKEFHIKIKKNSG